MSLQDVTDCELLHQLQLLEQRAQLLRREAVCRNLISEFSESSIALAGLSHAAQMRYLAVASTSLRGDASLHETLLMATHAARELIAAHQCTITLAENDNWESAQHTVSLSSRYEDWREFVPDMADPLVLALRTSGLSVMRLGQIQVRTLERGYSRVENDQPPRRGWIAAPLRSRTGTMMGIVQLSDKLSGDFTAEDESILIQLAETTSGAIESLRLAGISRERQREQEEAKRFLNLVLDNISSGVVFSRPDGVVTYANPEARKMAGRAAGEDGMERYLDLLPLYSSDGRTRVGGAQHPVTRGITGESVEETEFLLVPEQLPPRWIKATARQLGCENGAEDGTIFVFRDTTAERASELAVLRSELRFRRLVETNIIGVAVCDPSGVIREANDALLAMLQRSREDLAAGVLIWNLLTPANQQRQLDLIQAHLRASGFCQPVEVELLRSGGEHIPVMLGATSVGGDAPETLLFFLDLSERRELEMQLRQSQKMEAVGQLAGGIAHDFNNLLTVVTAQSDRILSRLGRMDPLYRDVEVIQKAGERAATLTFQLLAFSRKQVLKPRTVDLNAIIANIEKMLRRLIGEDIELKTVLASDLGHTRVDPGSIEQVIINLAVNARDAMPRGGSLVIESRNVWLDKGYSQHHVGVEPGHYVMLSVSDTGTGMDKATQDRIFEPFFTTKERGKGTGLGLSMVYGIVRQSGGHIWLYSEVGVGTAFKIYLPRETEKAENMVNESIPAGDTRGTETVLLVEDEEMVRGLVCSILQDKGYRVLEAANGGEALLLCERESGRIDIMVTDVVMPRMSGRDLANRLQSVRPNLKVLYISGYTDAGVVSHGMLEEGLHFLQKPFRPGELARKVRQILDEETPDPPRAAFSATA